MTFEKVLAVFADYLQEDTICQVVTTPQGYTVLYWDKSQEDWYSIVYCKTPEVMRDTFLGGCHDFLEYGFTKARRELTPEEDAIIKQRCEELSKQCDS